MVPRGPAPDHHLPSLSLNKPQCQVGQELNETVPGDVFMPSFSWFGVSGVNVTWTAVAPEGMAGPILPSSINTSWWMWLSNKLQNTTEPDGTDVNISSPGLVKSQSQASSISSWQVGLAVAGSVAG